MMELEKSVNVHDQRIFLSSRYSRRKELVGYRDCLWRLGHPVVSRWLDTDWEEKDDSGSSAAPQEYRKMYSTIDLEDVMKADCFIAFTEPPRGNSRGGRHVEFGLALGTGKRLIVVGHRENIFHSHPRVEFCRTWEDALVIL